MVVPAQGTVGPHPAGRRVPPVAHCRLKAWQETVLVERQDGVKITRVDAESAHEGALAGKTRLSLLMQHHPEQTGRYGGFEAFRGTLDGAPGETVLRRKGTLDDEGVDAQVISVESTGTAGLDGRASAFDVGFVGEGPDELTLRDSRDAAKEEVA